MKKSYFAGTLLVLTLAMLILSGTARGQFNSLENCREGAFSTEEDFMMTKGEPYDGDPYISDGDLLSPDGRLCMRNAELLERFRPVADLGLDAVDILDFKDRIVAFSTSLDDLSGMFSAGDLLFTSGGIIPNAAFVEPFGIKHDIGLDAVHFLGDQKNIIDFVRMAADIPPDGWGGGRLQKELEARNIDILFSIEGTQWGSAAGPILDGDLLSAATVSIIVPNALLLPNSVPAGIPNRGVDFGLDAVTAAREVDPEKPGPFFFSTEILFRGDPTFDDGDVLRQGNGVVIPHIDLIAAWYPRADFLGLDALWMPVGSGEPSPDPNIQTMCGDRPVVDFNGGLVPINGIGTGLYRANSAISPPGQPPRRPCGRFVPIDGFLPDTDVNRFRVVYRPAGDPAPPVGTASGIRTSWKLYEWYGWPINNCLPTGNLETDTDGWMDASDYLGAKDGTLTGCANSGLRLAVWDTDNAMGFGPPDKDGHYVLWLEWEDGGGTLHREPVEHHLQLDNTLPVINDLKLTYMSDGEEKPLPPCGGASAGTSIFRVNADFADDYYWGYRLRIRGGTPPASHAYSWHYYYQGTPEVANTDDTGTTPDNTTVFLREVDMTDLGASFVECCYDLDLWVRDAAIRHSFNRRVANDVSGGSGWWDNAFLTFSASP